MATRRNSNGDNSANSGAGFSGQRELIVITKASAGLRSAPSAITSVRGANVDSLASVLEEHKATMLPIFGNEERVARTLAAAPNLNASAGDLTTYYYVSAPEDQLDKLAKALLTQDLVESAYIKPKAEPPVWLKDQASADVLAPNVMPAITPNFVPQQLYLEVAPGGIDARFAWTKSGGKGQGVQIIDIEGAWRFSHEDLITQGGVIGGIQSEDIRWRNHGTAVVGTIGATENALGVTGICPQAQVRAISIFGTGQGSAKAITDAANALNPGDIILIELHQPGPRHNYESRDDQLGYIPMEFWPDNFAAIVYATAVRGVIVVEAGGNGGENLDDALYETRPIGFPDTWKNPFNLTNPPSGAILVGAGAPPPNTHGRDHGPDRSRLAFSNYGARLDVQGWGREVTTAGYGWLQGGADENVWYTDQFSGTSSASPVVVGSLGCLQGALRAAGKPLLTPATARDLLRTTGSAQQDAPDRPATQRIGNRPDLRQALQHLGLGKRLIKEITKEIAKEVLKEVIKDKEIVKELKEKDKEFKEKDKEFKEFKEFKEKDKEIREGKLIEIDPRLRFGGLGGAAEPTANVDAAKSLIKDKELKEFKELKEKEKDKDKEFKEFKEKEFKEKDKDKEFKEFKEKEFKEFKEKDKDIQEGKLLENDPRNRFDTLNAETSAGGSNTLNERLSALEQAVQELTHFISGNLRPDLQTSALNQETDLQALSEQLGKQAAEAKALKDNKDIEKLREG